MAATEALKDVLSAGPTFVGFYFFRVPSRKEPVRGTGERPNPSCS